MELPPGTRSTVDQIDVNLSLSHKNWHSSHGHKVRPKLTKIQLEQLTECFSLMDADGSGAIDADELGAALKLLGINIRPSEVAALVSGEQALHYRRQKEMKGQPCCRQYKHPPN